jgi:pyruvate formate lyase activating enzyme
VRGLVFDIKRFAVHDGPGIRTTVFTNGCGLRCIWCQNPEGLDREIRLWHRGARCIRCGECVRLCPAGALSAAEPDAGGEALGGTSVGPGAAAADKEPPFIRIDRDACTLCGECVRRCPGKALEFTAREMETRDVLAEVEKDRLFYEVSGGGVTVSGGDPFCQWDFNEELLGRCAERGLHTAMETHLHGGREVLRRFMRVVRLFIVDIKFADENRYRRYTGKGFRKIARNFDILVESGSTLLVRVPLIPGCTATAENLERIAKFVRARGKHIPIELLNFNPFARDKYRRLGMRYAFGSLASPLPEETVESLRRIVEGPPSAPIVPGVSPSPFP